jgi:NAD(P)-dependent dehydrogenase (short-subunit alcohol dehydrogenase family)
MSIAGKVIIITGAASGIGRALATGFYHDGARVIGFDVDQAGLIETKAECGILMLTVTGDVCAEKDVDRLVAVTMERFGHIDVLVNNAGISDRARFPEIRFEQWARVIQVNLMGAALCLHRILPFMLEKGHGRVINVVSRGAESTASQNTAYSASKAGLVSLTKNVAANIDRQQYPDVLVNGLIPGPTRTAIWGDEIPEDRIQAMQAPEVVYPHAKYLAELPAGGPTGRIFFNSQDYPIFARFNV